jgi:hypothetical protein
LSIVDKHVTTKDGLAAWKELFDFHEHAGDLDVYLLQQMDALNVEYTPTYPGGSLQFLKDKESAFTNLEKISTTSIYTDIGKRMLFIAKFSFLGDTADLTDNVHGRTNTWTEFAIELR